MLLDTDAYFIGGYGLWLGTCHQVFNLGNGGLGIGRILQSSIATDGTIFFSILFSNPLCTGSAYTPIFHHSIIFISSIHAY
uniref:Uncharacterized protein n=1 Tax=Rhizophora mucronata TaxID=61149 RepID=A0A2P2NZP9_RHIMU